MISDKSIETLLKVKGYYRVNFIRTIVAQNKIIKQQEKAQIKQKRAAWQRVGLEGP
jgi:hypothetical protein